MEGGYGSPRPSRMGTDLFKYGSNSENIDTSQFDITGRVGEVLFFTEGIIFYLTTIIFHSVRKPITKKRFKGTKITVSFGIVCFADWHIIQWMSASSHQATCSDP